MKRVIHGNQNFGYAAINFSGSEPTFGAPVMLPGMVSFDMEVNQDTTKVYADNVAYHSAKGAKVRTASGTFREITAAYAEFLGFKKNANGSVTDTGTQKPHCIFFESIVENAETGETTTRLHYLYNVKGGEPKVSTSTDEENVTVEEVEVNYDASTSTFVKDDEGKYVQYNWIDRTTENAALYDTFQTVVILPTSAVI